MTCFECNLAQKQEVVSYVRIENANVLISGCRKHLKMLLEQLDKARLIDQVVDESPELGDNKNG